MMSSSAERCEDGKDPPRLSSPNRYALRSKGPLPQTLKSSPPPQTQKRRPPPQPQKRSGPRCKYPRHRIPPGLAPAYDCEYETHEDPENISMMEEPELLDLSEMFAKGALSYLSQQGHHFKLFSLDYYEGGVVGGGARFHHNFQAKLAHDPDAPPETFFSQIFLLKDHRIGALTDLTVECCVSLGPSHSLPKKRDNRGCVFCSMYIHHPKDGSEGIVC
ncbi:uncharacterized protein LOC141642648 [Silene latifolia]|uniref:uncharacterized protein LOC141642648 n=1 Tax=Silene latifolia TaxID=37657 RepID=UPI003D77E196